jgi:hypothetical protein
MKTLGLSRCALTMGAASAMLAGCGGSQPPIGALGAMLQSRANRNVRGARRIVDTAGSEERHVIQ